MLARAGINVGFPRFEKVLTTFCRSGPAKFTIYTRQVTFELRITAFDAVDMF